MRAVLNNLLALGALRRRGRGPPCEDGGGGDNSDLGLEVMHPGRGNTSVCVSCAPQSGLP